MEWTARTVDQGPCCDRYDNMGLGKQSDRDQAALEMVDSTSGRDMSILSGTMLDA